MEKLPTNPKPLEAKIESKLIKGLIKPLTKITREIKKNIDNGEYAMVLGDDASGRLPALAMMEIINKANTRTDKPKIDTRFIALYPDKEIYDTAWRDLIRRTNAEQEEPKTELDIMKEKAERSHWPQEEIDLYEIMQNRLKANPGTMVDMEKVSLDDKKEAAAKKIKREFVDKLDKELFGNGKKILIVTELIERGVTLMPLFTALTEAKIPFEVIAVNTAYDRNAVDKFKKQGIKIYVGGPDAENLLGKHDLTGVRKDHYEFNLRTQPAGKYRYIKNYDDNTITTEYREESKDKRIETQAIINSARRDVHKVADKVFEKVWGQK